jgi:hypothetical protein
LSSGSQRPEIAEIGGTGAGGGGVPRDAQERLGAAGVESARDLDRVRTRDQPARDPEPDAVSLVPNVARAAPADVDAERASAEMRDAHLHAVSRGELLVGEIDDAWSDDTQRVLQDHGRTVPPVGLDEHAVPPRADAADAERESVVVPAHAALPDELPLGLAGGRMDADE